MSRNVLVMIGLAAGLSACAATPLQIPQAANIMVTRNAPAADCEFLGEVRGTQGNFWTADFTSDENIVIGARNKMRDAAYTMGANFVQVELENPSHNTADYSSGGVYSSTVIGNAYRCGDMRSARVVNGE
ncbi:MAG: DUF4156 domain-containing protein [Gammaproteobacteria bacterium]